MSACMQRPVISGNQRTILVPLGDRAVDRDEQVSHLDLARGDREPAVRELRDGRRLRSPPDLGRERALW